MKTNFEETFSDVFVEDILIANLGWIKQASVSSWRRSIHINEPEEHGQCCCGRDPI